MHKYILEDFGCKFCGSKNIVRYGSVGGIQRWWCKDCKRKFADNRALPEMKTPVHQIASALSCYYRGMSLNQIRNHLDQQFGNHPSDSTIYDWLSRFTKKAVDKTKYYKPNVGDVWVADETMVKIGGKNVWFWDIIDAKTRFLLASHLSPKRTTQDALALMKMAEARAGKVPQIVLTDKLRAYLDGIELAWGADTKHIPSKGFVKPLNTNLIERFHGTLKSRTKVMRGLKTPESALLILDGWLIYYNFFRPHEALGDKTPSEKAGLDFPIKNWLDVVKQSKGAKLYTSLQPHKWVILGLPTRYNIRRSKKKRKVAKQSREVMPMISSARLSK